MANKDNYLHIIKATINNFKGIQHKEVEFDGRSALIIGPNDTGKSSLIQAVMSPINSKWVPLEPVTKGEDRGNVELELSGRVNGETVNYVIKTFFSPEHSKGRLVIENGTGQRISGGASMLQSIIGEIGFDIMEFIRMGRTPSGGVSKEGVRKQIEILKSLLSVDDQKALYKLDKEYKEKYDLRTEVNREADRLQKLIDSNSFSQEFIEKYSEPIDAKTISMQLIEAEKHNKLVDDAHKIINEYPQKIKDAEASIQQLEEALTAARNERIDLLNRLDRTKIWADKNEKKDISAIEAQLDTISEHNENNRRINDIDAWILKQQEESSKSEELTSELLSILDKKKSVFASSSLPVKGLEFDEEKITYNGLPLHDDAQSTAKLIGIGLKIAMAYNSNLRLLVIRDGSLMDKAILEHVLKLCADHGYQVLIEMVSFERDENEIRFIEKPV